MISHDLTLPSYQLLSKILEDSDGGQFRHQIGKLFLGVDLQDLDLIRSILQIRDHVSGSALDVIGVGCSPFP